MVSNAKHLVNYLFLRYLIFYKLSPYNCCHCIMSRGISNC